MEPFHWIEKIMVCHILCEVLLILVVEILFLQSMLIFSEYVNSSKMTPATEDFSSWDSSFTAMCITSCSQDSVVGLWVLKHELNFDGIFGSVNEEFITRVKNVFGANKSAAICMAFIKRESPSPPTVKTNASFLTLLKDFNQKCEISRSEQPLPRALLILIGWCLP